MGRNRRRRRAFRGRPFRGGWVFFLFIGSGIVLVHLALALASLIGSIALAVFLFRFTRRWIASEPMFHPVPERPMAYDRHAQPVYESPPPPIRQEGPRCMGPACDRPATRKSHDGPWVWCDRCAGPDDVLLAHAGDREAIRPASRAAVADSEPPAGDNAPWWERRRINER